MKAYADTSFIVSLFHIAAALELGLDEFVTFDERQKVLARAAGLKVAI